MAETPEDQTDWSLATWDGARREALRRWAMLPLERMVAALEEMEALSGVFRQQAAVERESYPATVGAVQEQHSDSGSATDSRNATSENEVSERQRGSNESGK